MTAGDASQEHGSVDDAPEVGLVDGTAPGRPGVGGDRAGAAAPVAALTCRAVRVGYGAAVVIPSLDLTVARGEMVALLGPSGSGKSTILAALAGFLPVLGGEIAIGGRTVARPGRTEPPERRDIAFVFQGYALWPHMTALDTVGYPLRRRGMGTAEARERATAILDRLGIGALADRRPAALSGGEQQRVGLGRALARGASLYLFDEPTAHLDAALRERLQAEIGEQRRQAGAAALYATHDTAEALALADRVVLVRDGRIVQVGPPVTVYERPVDQWTARLTGPASILAIRVVDVDDGRAVVDLGAERVSIAVAADAPIGTGPALALVRPDWARPGGGVPARIADVAFRGTHTEYRLATGAGDIAVRADGRPTATRGDWIGVTVDRAWILPAVGERDGAP